MKRNTLVEYEDASPEVQAVYDEIMTTMGSPTVLNFLTALGLLCYTEFAGQVRYGRSTSTDNFNLLFDDLGPEYKAFRQSCPQVYDIFRCGMAHEYAIKQPSGIAMQAPHLSAGIGRIPDGRYFFVVENYWQDLWVQLQAIERDLAVASTGTAT